jgi:Ca-activated chloride channel homolog
MNGHGLVVLSRVFVSLLAAVLAAPVPPADRGAPTFSATARTVRVPVSVLDDHGEPVLDLRREDFQVSEEGRRQPLTFWSGERRPIRIVVALDVSLSMAGIMHEVERALGHFIDLLEPADETLVITFAEEVYVHGEFTSDRDALERVFARLKPAPGTSLYDAALEAIRRVASEPAESKAVVLVTDGEDSTSDARLADVRELARQHEVPIFGIGLGGGGGPLRDLADESGGRAVVLRNAKRTPGEPDYLKAAATSIALTLRHRYLLGYDEPESGKREWRKIRVDVDRPSVKVLARKGYYTGK